VNPKVDPDDPGRYQKFLIKDILGRGYTTYTKDREIGYATEVSIYTGVGPGGFADGDKTELFRPFAKEVSDGLCVLPLPVELAGGALETLEAPTYGFYLNMGTHVSAQGSAPALATNGKIIPPDGMIWSDKITGADLEALKKVLSDHGINYEIPAITAATGDFDSDDEKETIFFASPRIPSDGYPNIFAANGGLFSVGKRRRRRLPNGLYSFLIVYGRCYRPFPGTSPGNI